MHTGAIPSFPWGSHFKMQLNKNEMENINKGIIRQIIYFLKLKKHGTVLTMIQYFGHHHQTFHPFWPRHSLHHESRCFYKPRISWHTQLLWQNLIGKMIEKVHLFCFSTYAIRNHQHWHPWWQARPIQRPREQSSCWTSSWWIATLFLWVTEIKVIQSLLILAFL